MMTLPLVVVAMSGGVDSSVAAALLVEQGYPVIGVMLHLWSEPGSECDNNCCTPDAVLQARRVAAQLKIPFYTLDAAAYFRKHVVQYFIDEHIRGTTPNPCMVCNQEVRWGFLLNRARSLGGKFLATGHYARLNRDQHGKIRLLRGKDPNKDQSYVLSMLSHEQLSDTLFPLGEYKKHEVREMAHKYKLPVAERAESQDLCFLANNDYRDFLTRNASLASRPGPIVNNQGQVLGEHKGLAFYTIGQRKGLGLVSDKPIYVLNKDVENDILIVGGEEQLGCKELLASNLNWISGSIPSTTFRAQVKIRYKADFAWATVIPQNDDTMKVIFEHPLRDITAGQFAAFYDGDCVLGAGIIKYRSDPGGE
jgi:tRNA-uridine 2-sulfurtransferase